MKISQNELPAYYHGGETITLKKGRAGGYTITLEAVSKIDGGDNALRAVTEALSDETNLSIKLEGVSLEIIGPISRLLKAMTVVTKEKIIEAILTVIGEMYQRIHLLFQGQKHRQKTQKNCQPSMLLLN